MFIGAVGGGGEEGSSILMDKTRQYLFGVLYHLVHRWLVTKKLQSPEVRSPDVGHSAWGNFLNFLN